MKKRLIIFLLFLINFSFQECSQREKLKNREFVKTLFVFIAPSNTEFHKLAQKFKYTADEMKRIKILYEEVMCAIPSYDKFEYMTAVNYEVPIQNYEKGVSSKPKFELETDWNSARNRIKSSESILSLLDDCDNFEESLQSILSYKPSYNRIEVFYHIPKVAYGNVVGIYKNKADSLENFGIINCYYLRWLRDMKMNGHVNFIRYDSVEIFGYKSLNFPDLSLIDLNAKEVSQEVKQLARNFVDSILNIKPDPEVPKPIEPVIQKDTCDFFWKMFGHVVIGSGIGSIFGVGLAKAIACIIKKKKVSKSKSKSKEKSPEKLESAEKPVGKPAGKPSEKPTGNPAGKPAAKLAAKLAGKPAGKPEDLKIPKPQKQVTEVEAENEGGETTGGSTQGSTQGTTQDSTSGTSQGRKRKHYDFDETY